MSRTLLRQFTQIRKSDLYDDAVAAGSTMESAAVTIEDDLNSIRSQLKRFSGEAKWYTDLSGRNIDTLDTGLTSLENKKILYRVQKITDITVPATQNWVVLSVASSETPTETAAVGNVTTDGAVVAFHSGTFDTHSLDEVGGVDALNPKNLVIIRDATTGDDILSGGKRVYALIQSEVATDGHTFNDTTQQVQLSFVKENGTADDLIAVPVADIEGKSINYSYVKRLIWSSVPEQAFLAGAFVDATASASVTLDNAIDNQVGAATQTQNIDWRISDTYTLDFQDSTGAVDLLSIRPNVAGDVIQINIDTLDINNVNNVDMLNGLVVDSGGTAITIGSTAGEISSAGALTLASTAASDLTLNAAQEIIFTDGNKGASTFAGSLKLSDTSTEWSNYETKFGEVSLLNAIVQAANKDARTKYVAVVTAATVNEDVNVTGAGGTPNIDAQLGDYSAVTFVDDVNIFVNGVLMRNGADASANHDVYPGTTPANGDLKFEFKLKQNDVITMEIFAQA